MSASGATQSYGERARDAVLSAVAASVELPCL